MQIQLKYLYLVKLKLLSMKSNEETFIHKTTVLRLVIENVIAFFITLITVALLNKKSASTGLGIFVGSIILFSIIFIHNTFLLKPALQTQQWPKYIIKLVICLLIIFPVILYVDNIMDFFLNEKKLPDFFLTYKNAVGGALLFVVVGSVAYLVKYFSIERQLRLKADLMLKEKQLLLLQSQFNPHFLFNSLNSIKALTSTDPEKARYAIVLLSELLRKSLNTTTDSFIKIEDEITTVEEYLELEQLRYGERLKYEIIIEPKLNKYHVPAMCLQLMVENAIKHGISKFMTGGTINIHIYDTEKQFCIDVRNPGQVEVDIPYSGIGTRNIIENLKLLYSNSADFSIVNENDKTVLARLIIPIKDNQQ